MSLASCRSAIAQVFKEQLEDVHVSEHGGPFTMTELERVMKRTPALVVVCLGVSSVEAQGLTVTADASWGAFAITRDETVGKRDVAALLLIEAAAKLVPFQRWNNQASGAARALSIQNLYRSEVDAKGAALWAMRWRQNVDLETSAQTTLDTFETFFATHAITGSTATSPTTQDQVELEQ